MFLLVFRDWIEGPLLPGQPEAEGWSPSSGPPSRCSPCRPTRRRTSTRYSTRQSAIHRLSAVYRRKMRRRLHSSADCWRDQKPNWLCIRCTPEGETGRRIECVSLDWRKTCSHLLHKCGAWTVKSGHYIIEDYKKEIQLSPYFCSDVVEFGDEGVLDDVHGDFGGDDHEDVGEQHPQVVWGKKKVTWGSCKSLCNLIYVLGKLLPTTPQFALLTTFISCTWLCSQTNPDIF